MNLATAVLAGIVFGLLGAFPPALLFERALRSGTRVDVGAGLASIVLSFLTQTAALLAVYLAAAESLLEFGCAMVASFLLFWAGEAVRAWRAANGGSSA